MQQRIIKFRAWDKIENRMWPVNLINFEGEVAALEGYFGESLPVAFDNDGQVFATSPRRNKPLSLLALEQFTGLLDKNGKEIYEGDIVQFLDDNGMFTETVCRVVSWQSSYGAGWHFGTSWKDGEKRWSYPFPEDCKVIGNIHENPDLIESGKTSPEA